MDEDVHVREVLEKLYQHHNIRGRVIFTPFTDSSFAKLGVEKDVAIRSNNHTIAWTHRKYQNSDIYFISNQKHEEQKLRLSFRVIDKEPEVWNPVTGEIEKTDWKIEGSRSSVSLSLQPAQSFFIIFRKVPKQKSVVKKSNGYVLKFNDKWTLQFDKKYGGPQQKVIFDSLVSWTESPDLSIKYYSGTVIYRNSFNLSDKDFSKKGWIELDSVFNMATVKINGIDCGTMWTQPFTTEITKALKKGINTIEIEVSNTWHNRLIRDNMLPEDKRITWTTAPFYLKDKPLLPAGITGKIKLVIE